MWPSECQTCVIANVRFGTSGQIACPVAVMALEFISVHVVFSDFTCTINIQPCSFMEVIIV